MEGLLPMVYKTIKKSRIRRQYEYLSSGTAQSYNSGDFYLNDYSNKQYNLQMTPPEKTDRGYRAEGKAHRRHNSIHVDHLGRFSPENAANARKLVRFSSHRFFSCVSGV